MPTFITLVSWTEKGVQEIKDSPVRLDGYKKALSQAGGTLKGFYMVSGRYDMVVITEAPNYEAVAKVALVTASKGSVRTETMRAFTEDEYRKIVSDLP